MADLHHNLNGDFAMSRQYLYKACLDSIYILKPF